MDELLLRMFAGSGLDLTVMITFIAFAVIYLIIPVIGYHSQQRKGIVVALYALIGYTVLSLIQGFILQIAEILDRGAGRGGMFPGGAMPRGEGSCAFLAIILSKAVLWIVAMFYFVASLRSLHLRQPGWPEEDENPKYSKVDFDDRYPPSGKD